MNNLPVWFTSESGRKSYFQNHHGESWCAVVRPDAILFSGVDIDWDLRRIDQPDFDKLHRQLTTGDGYRIKHFDHLVVNEEERLWFLSLVELGKALRPYVQVSQAAE